MKLILMSFCLLISGCGALGGAMGAMKVMRDIEEKVCPKYPMDPNCTKNAGKTILVNGKYCTTFEEWNQEMENVRIECRPPGGAPGSHKTISKKVHLSKLSLERRAYCKARHSFPRGDVALYREHWQKTASKVFEKEKIIFNRKHRCKMKTDLRVQL